MALKYEYENQAHHDKTKITSDAKTEREQFIDLIKFLLPIKKRELARNIIFEADPIPTLISNGKLVAYGIPRGSV